jgi:hypothetical protein
MNCLTYAEWCMNKVKESNLKTYIVPYINFKRLLIDEYYESKRKNQVLFCIAYDKDNNLTTIQNPTEKDGVAYVCTMPYLNLPCKDCEEKYVDGWWKDGEFLCNDCWEDTA